MITTLYVSGPMTGYKDHNFSEFERTTKLLRDAGYEVISPHEINIDVDPRQEYLWEHCLRKDIKALMDAEGVATLIGWEHSRGAMLECHIAQALSMPVKPYQDWLEL